jgi:beta-fructofuranosidase
MKIDRRCFVSALLGSAALPMLRVKLYAASPSNAASVAALAADPRRPQFHLLPPANWMNDPNGPIYWNGQYHMFYQYNPGGAYWGDMHWGHAISPDMVRWRHLSVALAPTPGGPDAEGCFTGTAVVQDGRVTILYTGVRESTLDQATIKDGHPPLRETQCLAVADNPDLTSWTKAAAPVLAAPPPEFQVNGFRDPSPWKQGDWWYMVTACGIADQGGAVLLYRSKDLRAWEFLHILARRDREGPARFDSFDPWEVWECPEFFPLGDWHVLIYSTGGKTYWQSGKLDEKKMTFVPEQSGLIDYGTYYAAKTQLDKAGNRVIWGWITETRPLDEYKAAGWAGLMSLPRVLSAAADGTLRFTVAPEVEQLRQKRRSLSVSLDKGEMQQQIDSMRLEGCSGEIQCTVRRSTEPFALNLSDSESGATPWLILEYDPLHRNQVVIDGRPVPVLLSESEDLEFHLYADASVIELLVNGQIAFTKRFYYKGNSAPNLRLKFSGKSANVVSLSVWQLSPISADRLTT